MTQSAIKRQLATNLRKLGLPLGFRALVSITSRDLEVPIDAADHEELLELLGTLDEIEVFARDARGNHKLLGALLH